MTRTIIRAKRGVNQHDSSALRLFDWTDNGELGNYEPVYAVRVIENNWLVGYMRAGGHGEGINLR